MIKSNTNKKIREFTMVNSLQSKKERRQRLTSMSIDEKIKIVEELREKVKPLNAFRVAKYKETESHI